MLMLIYFFLIFPFPDDLDFSFKGHFRFFTRNIIVFLCLVNLHLYYFNNFF